MGIAKITIFIPEISIGGIQSSMANLANELILNGYDVQILYGKHSNGANTLQSTLSSLISYYNLGELKFPKDILPLIKYLKNHKPDLIITTTRQNTISTAIAKRLLGVKTIKHMAIENAVDSKIGREIKFWKNIPFDVLSYIYLKDVDHIVAVSEYVKSNLVKKYSYLKNISRIYNPVISENFYKLLNEKDIDPRFIFKSTKGEKRIIYVGRLAKIKNIETLIKAVKILNFDYKLPSKLLIVGEGPEKENLIMEAKKNSVENEIIFYGSTSNPYPLMKAADVLVLPSLTESFGNVLVEALSAGTMVVASDCPGGIREILRDGEYGELFTPGNSQELAKKLCGVLKLQKKFKEFDPTLYTAKYSSAEYIKLITSILNR